jgi:hypothetical protein
MIIVLDSNIWLGELGLNSSLGAATRFFIRHNNARIALPEIVRFEVEETFELVSGNSRRISGRTIGSCWPPSVP